MKTKEEVIRCHAEGCQRTFTTQLSEIRHYGLLHGPKAPWRRKPGIKCPDCEVTFGYQGPMREHLRNDHLRQDDNIKLPTSGEFAAIRASGKKRLGPPRKIVPQSALTAHPSLPEDRGNAVFGDARDAIRAYVRTCCGQLNIEARALDRAAQILQDNLVHLER